MRLKHRIIAGIITVFMLTALVASAVLTAIAIPGAYTAYSPNFAHGIDVSYWNVGDDYSLIDFARVKAAGCSFVMLRLGTGYGGENNLDSAFVELYTNARAADMDIGLYFFSYGTTYAEAVDDAQWAMNIIESYGMYFEYPLYYDVETEDQAALSSAGLTSLCRGWCDTLVEAGYFPGVYGIGSTIDNLTSEFKSEYDVWYARVATDYATGNYTNQFNTTDYNYSDYCGVWQYAWFDYSYDGITQPDPTMGLDVDVSYKDYPTIMETYGYNNVPIPALDAAINSALNAVFYDYSEAGIAKLRSVYTEAVALKNNASATNEQKLSKADELNAAIANIASADESVISANKRYTATAPNRAEGDSIDWDDDGIRLTDGTKGDPNVLHSGYSAWAGDVTVDVTVDLGSSQRSNIFRVYAAGGDWGINLPSYVSVSYSDDGQSFTPVDTSYTRTRMGKNSPWTSYRYDLVSAEAVNARYIRFTVTPDGNHTWLDEVEVVYDATPAVSGGIYIDGINGCIASGITYLFTPSFGTITTAKANHAYTRNIVAKWNADKNAYIVTSNTVGSGVDTTPSVTLASDEIMIAAHNWETGVTDGTEVLGSERNTMALASLSVGDTLVLNGIDTVNGYHDVAPYISGEYITLGDINGDEAVDALDYVLLKRHVMRTYSLSARQLTGSDINKDGRINIIDYLLLKRVVLGTYTL